MSQEGELEDPGRQVRRSAGDGRAHSARSREPYNAQSLTAADFSSNEAIAPVLEQRAIAYFLHYFERNFIFKAYTVKRVDEVVRHPHLVTQDQKTQVSNKFFDIPVENFTINIELFRHFSQVSN